MEEEEEIVPRGFIRKPVINPQLDRLNILADICEVAPYRHEVGGFQKFNRPVLEAAVMFEENIVPLQHNLYYTLSGMEEHAMRAEQHMPKELQHGYQKKVYSEEEKARMFQQTAHRQAENQPLSESAQQPQAAGMDWREERPVNTEVNHDHQRQSSGETPVAVKSSGIRGSPEEETAKQANFAINPLANPSLVKLAEAFARQKDIGVNKALKIFNSYLNNEGRNVPGTFMPTAQIAPQGI